MVYKLDGTQANSGTAPADADLVPFYDASASGTDPTDKIADMNMTQLAAYVATKTGFGGLNNMDAVGDPAASNDTGEGYEVGSMWYNQTSNALFVAEDVSSAAAVWTNVSASVTEKVLEDLWSAAATPILATGDKFPFADVSGTDTIGTATAPDICSTGGALLKDGTTDLTGDLVINERADHADTPTAGKGQVWVRSDTPNVLVFTDDAGTDTVLGAGGGDLWTDPLDSDIIPDTTNTYDLGSAAARFAECHVTTLDVNGNITLLGTVDGRDVAADGAILDSITPTSKYETAVASDFPDATDDSLGVFALWIHTTDQRAWICVDDTAATAVWLELATGAGDAWGDVVDAVITPDADGTRDLGLTGTRFATAYVDDLDVTTNIVVGGTVDGRDVAADGATLDALQTSISLLSVEKNTAGTITKGQVVYVAGYDTDKPTVELADADNAAAIPPIGVANGSITDTAAGDVVLDGLLDGFDTSSFTAGDNVYLDTTAGALVAQRPAEEWVYRIGQVVYSHATNGMLKVNIEKVPGRYYTLASMGGRLSTQPKNDNHFPAGYTGTIEKIELMASTFQSGSDASNKWVFTFEDATNSDALLLAAGYDTNASGDLTWKAWNDMGALTATTADREVTEGSILNMVSAVTGTPPSFGDEPFWIRVTIIPAD